MPIEPQLNYEKIDEAIGKKVRTLLSQLLPQIYGQLMSKVERDDLLSKYATAIVKMYKAARLLNVSQSPVPSEAQASGV